MVYQECDDRLGNGVINVLLDNVEVRDDQPLDHVGFGLLAKLWVFMDLDDSWD